MLRLHVFVHAVGLDGQRANRTANITIMKENRVELVVERREVQIAAIQRFKFEPWIVHHTCEGIQKMKYDFEVMNGTMLDLKC